MLEKPLDLSELTKLGELLKFVREVDAIEIEERINRETIEWKRELLNKVSFLIWGTP